MANEKLTAQQRALMFGASTRQHFQMMGMQEVNGGAQTVSFRIPKARILQGVKVLVEGKLTIAGDTYEPLPLDVYRVIRRLSVDFNNGFMPVVASGEEIALNNFLYPNPEMLLPAQDWKTLANFPEELTEGEHDFSFVLDVPLTINYRDPVGLVLAQNQETNIDVVIDIANGSDMVHNAEGVTATLGVIKITPEVTSFSIPSDSRAFPDMSVLKVLDSRNESFTSGQSYIKLSTGMIYRKLIFKFEDVDGQPFTPEDITSNIELILNTADVPYSVNPKMLRAINTMQAGLPYPDGCYYFSFDFQGINGYGGSRDYIDAERITEFAVRFNAAKAGKLTIISEKLSRLIAG